MMTVASMMFVTATRAFAPSNKPCFQRWTQRALRSTATQEVEIPTDSNDTSIYARDAETLASLQSPFLQVMRDRGFLHQCTNIQLLDEETGGESTMLLPILDLMPRQIHFMWDPCCKL